MQQTVIVRFSPSVTKQPLGRCAYRMDAGNDGVTNRQSLVLFPDECEYLFDEAVQPGEHHLVCAHRR